MALSQRILLRILSRGHSLPVCGPRGPGICSVKEQYETLRGFAEGVRSRTVDANQQRSVTGRQLKFGGYSGA